MANGRCGDNDATNEPGSQLIASASSVVAME
jgi:hypothetical protein